MNTYNGQMSIYKCWLGSKLPNSKLCLKTRSVVQKPVQQATAERLCSSFRGTVFHSLGRLVSMNRFLKPRCSYMSSLLILVYFPHKGLGLPFLVLLQLPSIREGSLGQMGLLLFFTLTTSHTFQTDPGVL